MTFEEYLKKHVDNENIPQKLCHCGTCRDAAENAVKTFIKMVKNDCPMWHLQYAAALLMFTEQGMANRLAEDPAQVTEDGTALTEEAGKYLKVLLESAKGIMSVHTDIVMRELDAQAEAEEKKAAPPDATLN